LNGDGSILYHPALRVLGDYIAGAPDEVDGTAGRLLGREGDATQEYCDHNA